MRSVALLTTRKANSFDEEPERSLTVPMSTEVDSYLGYAGDSMHLCMRISIIRTMIGDPLRQYIALFDV